MQIEIGHLELKDRLHWEAFLQAYPDDEHLRLACHAAFPVALTSDLLYKIWLNFRPSEAASNPLELLATVSDILHSPLCREIGRDIYEMHPDLRTALLENLQIDPAFGDVRIMELARFLRDYLRYNPSKIPTPSFREAQAWVASSYLEPEKAAQTILALLEQEDQDPNVAHKVDFYLSWTKQRNHLHRPQNDNAVGADALLAAEQMVQGFRQYRAGNMEAAMERFRSLERFMESGEAAGKGFKAKVPAAVWQAFRPVEVQVKPRSLAQELIEKERKERTGILDLGNCGLTEVPEEVFELEWLEVLSFSQSYTLWYDEERSLDKHLREEQRKGTEKNNSVKNRIGGMEKAIRKMELSIEGDKKDLDFQVQKASSADGQLEAQIRQAKIIMINERIEYNKVKLGEMNITLLDLQKRLAAEKEKGEKKGLGGQRDKKFGRVYGERKVTSNRGKPNQLKSIPVAFDKLKKLKTLALSGDYDTIWQLSDLSPLSGLLQLKSLAANNTMISDLRFLSKFKNLKGLSIAKTKVSDLSPLSELIGLKRLYIEQTEISDLSALRRLLQLEELNILNTKVSDLSPVVKLLNLNEINISGTLVNDLTPIKKLDKLRELSISYTKINDLTPIKDLHLLQGLDISKTNITDLSPILPLFEQNLKDLYSDGCALKSPPVEVVNQGREAILAYFKDLNEQKSKVVYLSEANLFVLGEGGAGKTSLVRKLLNPDNPLSEEREITNGIGIYHHDLKLPNGNNFRLNIWDFGGQEIYYATHQFFLRNRSLYILLDDSRTGDKTVNDPNFNYWLQTVELYGGNSPLLIIQNEKGDRSKQLDLRGMQGRFSFVKDAKATNLLTCRGLDGVWQAIEYWLKQLPHIGEEQPKAWVDIRRELERLAREEGRDHISIDEYYRICAQHYIPERERSLFLSGYLHDFGAFLHFQDHPLLKRILVLNPQWATDAVYKVLDCEEVRGNFGRFTRSTLGRIWADDRYADQHDELLALMEKFELCYKLPDEKSETWLAPQLLSVLKPEALAWDDSDNLQIRYEYEFMPKGLLSQHIVRNHRYIGQTELAWKSGAVFERASSQALVTEAWGSRNIRIRTRGLQAKELLTILSEDFDRMHKRLEGLKVRKMIPCNCQVCAKALEPHFYDYEKLEYRRFHGKRTVECDLSYELVSITSLFEGIIAEQIQNPRQLLEIGQLGEALRLIPQTSDSSLLLSQLIRAEKEYDLGLIEEKELTLLKNRIMKSALKLL